MTGFPLLGRVVLMALLTCMATPIPAGARVTLADTTSRNLDDPNVTFYVDPASNAQRQAEEWESTRPDDARAMLKIAGQPSADWFLGESSRSDIAARLDAVTARGSLPVFVLYNIPDRDCGLYSAGGAVRADAYRDWIAEVAAGIGNHPAVVILEPDAIAGIDCLDTESAESRYTLLNEAVDALGSLSSTDVYIDAGTAIWHPAEEIARRLERAGIDRADGFALNVSNFLRTDETTAYGLAISGFLGREGGTHFIIDTSRNGNGAWEADDPETWCNPPGRALGVPPTVDTGDPLVDAWLWIKTPGESDGECRGAPPAGTWYPEYALELARNAHWEERGLRMEDGESGI